MNRDKEQIPRKPAFGAAMPRDLQLHALPGVERGSCPDDLVSLFRSLILQCLSVTLSRSLPFLLSHENHNHISAGTFCIAESEQNPKK